MIKEAGVVFNVGLSTLKIGVFDIDAGSARRIGSGTVVLGERPRLKYLVDEEVQEIDLPDAAEGIDRCVISQTLDRMLPSAYQIGFVGHRIVHGGLLFDGPAFLNDATISKIESLTPMAPVHQPRTLRVIDAVRSLHPSVLQTGTPAGNPQGSRASLVMDGPFAERNGQQCECYVDQRAGRRHRSVRHPTDEEQVIADEALNVISRHEHH